MSEDKIKLKDALTYNGQYVAARKLLMKHMDPKEVAVLTDEGVLEKLEKWYTPVSFSADGERVVLLRNEDVKKFEEMSVYLDR